MRFSRAQLGAGAAIVLAAGLVGCNNSEGGRLALTGSSYCTPFRTTSTTTSSTSANPSGLATPAAATDPANAFDDCIHRWAYAMAPARDPADIVAHAVVDACGQAMNAWNQQATTPAPGSQDQGYQNGQNGPDQGYPQGYGPPPGGGRGDQQQMQQQMQQAQSSPVAQHMQIAEARSLFYVIQARSAGCAPPPANTLVSRPAT